MDGSDTKSCEPPGASATPSPRPGRLGLLVWVFAAAGVAMRVAQYVANRSLWVDEAMLALNLRDHGFAALVGPLDYDQAAPVGFLLASKAVTLALGYSEYALRLLPLVASVASVFLFRKLILRTLTRGAGAIAMLLFAISSYLVYYGAEVKQYSRSRREASR